MKRKSIVLENNKMEEDNLDNLSLDEEKILTQMGLNENTRRTFLKQISTTGISLCAYTFLTPEIFATSTSTLPEHKSVLMNEVKVNLRVNKMVKPLTLDSRTSLLNVLRERLNLTGTKKGCDHGQDRKSVV